MNALKLLKSLVTISFSLFRFQIDSRWNTLRKPIELHGIENHTKNGIVDCSSPQRMCVFFRLSDCWIFVEIMRLNDIIKRKKGKRKKVNVTVKRTHKAENEQITSIQYSASRMEMMFSNGYTFQVNNVVDCRERSYNDKETLFKA